MNLQTLPAIRILAIDPGTSNGVIVADYESTNTLTLPTFIHNETIHYDDLIPKLIKIIHETKPDIMVVEDFAVYRRKAEALATAKLEVVRAIGITKTIAYYEKLSFILQRPIDVNRTQVEQQVNKLLRHHERSAYKHAKYYRITHLTRNPK